VCISAVKERDIEAKLKLVENEWSAQRFQFSTFKTRGELLLKGTAYVRLVTLNIINEILTHSDVFKGQAEGIIFSFPRRA